MTDEELDALVERLKKGAIQVAQDLDNIDIDDAAAAITALRTQLAAANARAEAALAAQIEADAGICDAKGWPGSMSLERYAELSVYAEARMDAADALASSIRAQPHDRTALDRMLAEHEVRLRESRENALREASEICSSIRQRIANGPMPEGARFDYEQSILAMIDSEQPKENMQK